MDNIKKAKNLLIKANIILASKLKYDGYVKTNKGVLVYFIFDGVRYEGLLRDSYVPDTDIIWAMKKHGRRNPQKAADIAKKFAVRWKKL